MDESGQDDHFYSALREGISEFNRGHYFEAHDVLEALWMETRGRDRLFLQGLIQTSVGFYHLFNRNFVGAVSQFTKSLAKLEDYLPEHRGVNLSLLTEEVRGWKLIAERGRSGGPVTLEPRKAPVIMLIED